jgi:hypothetical protein
MSKDLSLDECTPIITPTDSDFVNKKEKKKKAQTNWRKL